MWQTQQCIRKRDVWFTQEGNSLIRPAGKLQYLHGDNYCYLTVMWHRPLMWLAKQIPHWPMRMHIKNLIPFSAEHHRKTLYFWVGMGIVRSLTFMYIWQMLHCILYVHALPGNQIHKLEVTSALWFMVWEELKSPCGENQAFNVVYMPLWCF